jgi:flavodoxin
MPVWTFLEACDLTGKTVLPFCTHEGSGLGDSARDLKRLCPGATVLKGLPIRGSAVREAEQDLAAWLRRSGVTG